MRGVLFFLSTDWIGIKAAQVELCNVPLCRDESDHCKQHRLWRYSMVWPLKESVKSEIRCLEDVSLILQITFSCQGYMFIFHYLISAGTLKFHSVINSYYRSADLMRIVLGSIIYWHQCMFFKLQAVDVVNYPSTFIVLGYLDWDLMMKYLVEL